MDSVKSLTNKAIIQTTAKVTVEAVKESEKEKSEEASEASKQSKRFQRNPIINEIMARKKEAQKPQIQEADPEVEAPTKEVAKTTTEVVTSTLVQIQISKESSTQETEE